MSVKLLLHGLSAGGLERPLINTKRHQATPAVLDILQLPQPIIPPTWHFHRDALHAAGVSRGLQMCRAPQFLHGSIMETIPSPLSLPTAMPELTEVLERLGLSR